MKLSETSRIAWLLGFDCLHFAVAVALMIFGLSFTSHISHGMGGGPLSQLASDWDGPLGFTDIKVVRASNLTCPDGYTSLTSYKWKGTRTGCYCPFNIFYRLKPRSCSSEDRENGCWRVHPIPSKEINDLGGFTLCGKLNDISYT